MRARPDLQESFLIRWTSERRDLPVGACDFAVRAHGHVDEGRRKWIGRARRTPVRRLRVLLIPEPVEVGRFHGSEGVPGSENEHGVAVAEETVTFPNGFGVCFEDEVAATGFVRRCKRTYQHQESGSREVEVRQ